MMFTNLLHVYQSLPNRRLYCLYVNISVWAVWATCAQTTFHIRSAALPFGISGAHTLSHLWTSHDEHCKGSMTSTAPVAGHVLRSPVCHYAVHPERTPCIRAKINPTQKGKRKVGGFSKLPRGMITRRISNSLESWKRSEGEKHQHHQSSQNTTKYRRQAVVECEQRNHLLAPPTMPGVRPKTGDLVAHLVTELGRRCEDE